MGREIAIGRIYKHYSGEYFVAIDVTNDMVTYRSLSSGIEWVETPENFLNSKVPSGSLSTQEYCFERADVIHKLNKPKLELAVINNDGYCPCAVTKTDDTKCMCKEFRERMSDGPCHCGLYNKTWVGDQM